MINFDFGPAQILGMLVILGSTGLYITRIKNPRISRDGDVVVSSIAILVGGILLFQGWRLDPLLLFGQMLTAGVAGGFALEAIKLRSLVAERGDEQVRERGMEQGGRAREVNVDSMRGDFFSDVSTRPGSTMEEWQRGWEERGGGGRGGGYYDEAERDRYPSSSYRDDDAASSQLPAPLEERGYYSSMGMEPSEEPWSNGGPPPSRPVPDAPSRRGDKMDDWE